MGKHSFAFFAFLLRLHTHSFLSVPKMSVLVPVMPQAAAPNVVVVQKQEKSCLATLCEAYLTLVIVGLVITVILVIGGVFLIMKPASSPGAQGDTDPLRP